MTGFGSDNLDQIERLVAALESISATNDNLDTIDGIERELDARLSYFRSTVGKDDPAVLELTRRVIDTMTGVSVRIELETVTTEDFGA
jgi:hypothetical protein